MKELIREKKTAGKPPLFIRFLRALARILYRPRVAWLDDSVRDRIAGGGNVIVCNHMAVSDGPVVLAALRGRFCPVVALDWYRKPLLRPVLKAADCIPVDRYGAGLEWSRAARGALKEGKNILIFPEGRVRKDGVLGEFKQGTALLCMLTGAPVIPLSISWLYTVFSPPRLTVGEAVETDRAGLSDEEGRKRFCAALRQTVSRNRDARGSARITERKPPEG